MVTYKCTQCEWTGNPEKVYICPECFTGHSPLYRLMKIGGNYVCPNCDWKGSKNEAKESQECPKCKNEYLKEV